MLDEDVVLEHADLDRSPRWRTAITRSTDSRRARNSASVRICARRRPASRPSRRRWRLASSRVEPRTPCTPSPSSASRGSRGSRTCTTVFGGSASSAGSPSSPLPRRRRRRRRRGWMPPPSSPGAVVDRRPSSPASSAPSSGTRPRRSTAPRARRPRRPRRPRPDAVSSSPPRPRPRPRAPAPPAAAGRCRRRPRSHRSRRRRRRTPLSAVGSGSAVAPRAGAVPIGRRRWLEQRWPAGANSGGQCDPRVRRPDRRRRRGGRPARRMQRRDHQLGGLAVDAGLRAAHLDPDLGQRADHLTAAALQQPGQGVDPQSSRAVRPPWVRGPARRCYRQANRYPTFSSSAPGRPRGKAAAQGRVQFSPRVRGEQSSGPAPPRGAAVRDGGRRPAWAGAPLPTRPLSPGR